LQKQFEITQFDSKNKYKCEQCEEKTKAKHYVQICYLPEVIIFHIKRFDMQGRKLKKDLTYSNVIDLSVYMDANVNNSGVSSKYQLIGLAEHVGASEQSGHYTAHTLRHGQWYKFDDEYFKSVSVNDAMSREAYLLFYQR
jgi:ubiquitin C-terminal hydrolase